MGWKGGNFEYKKFAQWEIEKLEQHYSADQLLEKVQKRGGGSWKGFWLAVALFVGYLFVSIGLELAIQSFTGSTSSTLTTYTNEDYGVSFDYPSSWNNSVEISYGSWMSNSEATIDFVYQNTSKEIEQNVFSVIVYDEILEDSHWENGNERYITNDGDKTFTLLISGEVNEDFLDSKNIENLKFVQDMIEELDTVVGTFRLE